MSLFNEEGLGRKFASDKFRELAHGLVRRAYAGDKSDQADFEARRMDAIIDRHAGAMEQQPSSRTGTITSAMGYWEMMQGAALRPEVQYTREMRDLLQKFLERIAPAHAPLSPPTGGSH